MTDNTAARPGASPYTEPMPSPEVLRNAMVDQLIDWRVTSADSPVAHAMRRAPRHLFAPDRAQPAARSGAWPALITGAPVGLPCAAASSAFPPVLPGTAVGT